MKIETQALMPDSINQAYQTKRGRGRPRTIRTEISDFALQDLGDYAKERAARIRHQDAALRRLARDRGDKLEKARPMPLFRALDEVRWQPEFRSSYSMTDPRTLQNQLSLAKKVRNWEPPDCPVEHEEAQAAWEARRSANFRECNETPDGVQPGTKPGEDA
jgi:hypothetical protein